MDEHSSLEFEKKSWLELDGMFYSYKVVSMKFNHFDSNDLLCTRWFESSFYLLGLKKEEPVERVVKPKFYIFQFML